MLSSQCFVHALINKTAPGASRGHPIEVVTVQQVPAHRVEVPGVIAGWIGQGLSRRVVPMEQSSPALLGGALLLLWVAAALSGWSALRTASGFDPAVILKAETI